MIDFPENKGFKWNSEYKEWQKLHSSLILIIIEKSINIWEFSFLDENDVVNLILIGDEESIIESILNLKIQ